MTIETRTSEERFVHALVTELFEPSSTRTDEIGQIEGTEPENSLWGILGLFVEEEMPELDRVAGRIG